MADLSMAAIVAGIKGGHQRIFRLSLAPARGSWENPIMTARSRDQLGHTA